MDREALRRTLTLASAFKDGDRAVGGVDDERSRARGPGGTPGDQPRRHPPHHPHRRPGKRGAGPIPRSPVRRRDRRLAGRPRARRAARSRRCGLGADLRRRPEQRGDCRRRQGHDARRAVVRGARDRGAGWRGSAPRLAAPGTSARAFSPTAPATTSARFSSRSSRGSRTDAATSSSASTRLPTISTRSCGSSSCSSRWSAASNCRPASACSRIWSSSTRRSATPAWTSGSRAWRARRRALTGMVGLDVDGLADLARAFGGLYFETGQGSEVTNGAAERRRHGHAGSAHLRRGAAHPADGAGVDDRQRRRRLHRPGSVRDRAISSNACASRTS